MERFIPEYDEQLNFAAMMRNKIICTYSNDTSSFLVIFDSTGKNLHQSKLPRGHTFGEFSGNSNDSVLVFSFHSFFTPDVMYTINILNYKSSVLSTTYIHYKYEDIKTKIVYYASKDGTKIPMYLTYKNGLKLKGQSPVILYGYGGFGVKMEPFFDVANVIFIRNGGILAVPCIRGGGDYPGWHEQGARLKKQNTFDDFIAAAEYLIKNNYTNPEKMAAMGGSNGGLLVGAVMLQRPDLFKVIVARAGILDMMRYQLYNIGYHYKEEYGDISDSMDFKNLIHYSPVQNVKKDINYPATLVVTSDNDDRVDPFHSFKFLATLQADAPGKNPYILFYEKKAGHMESNDFDRRENTDAFIYGFIYKYLGIENKIEMPEFY
jgi:prolyl oligopeptidase